jgi:hypothetical protein
MPSGMIRVDGRVVLDVSGESRRLRVSELGSLLKFTLKLTLKQPQHVSVQSQSSVSAFFELAKVTVVKIIN